MVFALLSLLGVNPPIKVACVGDSITFGYSLPEATRANASYPGVLSQRLGGGYVVKNFGHTGCTIMNLDWLPSLIKTDEYKKALAFKPNVVLIMGGTNDGIPRNWAHVNQFDRDLKQITHSFLNLSTHPKVIILTPPRLCTRAERGVAEDDHCENVNQNLPPILRNFARTNALLLIDTRLAVTSRDCYTVDGIHLNEKGCMKMANQVAYGLLKKQKIHK